MITVAYIFAKKSPQTYHRSNIYKLAVGSKGAVLTGGLFGGKFVV